MKTYELRVMREGMLDDFMNIQQQARVLKSLGACLPRSHKYASGGKYRLKTILS